MEWRVNGNVTVYSTSGWTVLLSSFCFSLGVLYCSIWSAEASGCQTPSPTAVCSTRPGNMPLTYHSLPLSLFASLLSVVTHISSLPLFPSSPGSPPPTSSTPHSPLTHNSCSPSPPPAPSSPVWPPSSNHGNSYSREDMESRLYNHDIV